MKTYRYHGHSMSDPGVTYRTKEEIENIRKTRDCIQLLGKKCIDLDFITEEEFNVYCRLDDLIRNRICKLRFVKRSRSGSRKL